MSDIPARILVELQPYSFLGYDPCWVWHSAGAVEDDDGSLVAYVPAAEIERLTAALAERDAEVARLREALEPFALISIEGLIAGSGYVAPVTQADYFHRARAALRKEADNG